VLLFAVCIAAALTACGSSSDATTDQQASEVRQAQIKARAQLRAARHRAHLRRKAHRAALLQQQAEQRQAESEEAEARALEEEASEATTSECDPNYSGCLNPTASDYDCEGGSGDGPEYTGTVTVTGEDHYGLDSDSDGVGCESD
jgi:hypothetical protein